MARIEVIKTKKEDNFNNHEEYVASQGPDSVEERIRTFWDFFDGRTQDTKRTLKEMTLDDFKVAIEAKKVSFENLITSYESMRKVKLDKIPFMKGGGGIKKQYAGLADKFFDESLEDLKNKLEQWLTTVK